MLTVRFNEEIKGESACEEMFFGGVFCFSVNEFGELVTFSNMPGMFLSRFFL